MRNAYPGICYRCGKWCGAGDGDFERFAGRFRVQHAHCAIINRGKPDPARTAYNLKMMFERAKGTGKRAQKARRKLRESGIVFEDTDQPIRYEDF